MNFSEIFIVNGIGIFLMIFLLVTRIENTKERHLDDRIFDIMIWLTIAGCLAEALSFMIDGKSFAGNRALAYFLNSFCFVGTCSVGFLWCLYMDLRVFHDISKMRKQAKFLIVPLLINLAMNLINLNGCGIVFTISEDNVYTRGSLVSVAYIILFFYFIYSIFLVDFSKKKTLNIKFFHAFYFIIPCMLGTIIQGTFYGITLGWASVSIALLFVYIQKQSLNAFVDSLSGLYNRRYMDCILSKSRNDALPLYGIMMDVNGFKQINDTYGHSIGDQALRIIGKILLESMPDQGIAIRYAGDEFLLLLHTDDEAVVKATMQLIREQADKFNATHSQPFTLSLAMGYSKFDSSTGNTEKFLSDLDEGMYAAKRLHYQQSGIDRRKRDKS